MRNQKQSKSFNQNNVLDQLNILNMKALKSSLSAEDELPKAVQDHGSLKKPKKQTPGIGNAFNAFDH